MNNDMEERFASLVAVSRRVLTQTTSNGLPQICIGMATCGLAAGAAETRAAFEETLVEHHLAARITPVGCLGHCYAEPLVTISNPGFPPILYHQVTPGKAKALVTAFLAEGDPLFEYVLGATEENDLIPVVMDFPGSVSNTGWLWNAADL
jgi:NADH-quinone oxidoreductase subunit F